MRNEDFTPSEAWVREVVAAAFDDFADRCAKASEHVGGMQTIAAFASQEAARLRGEEA